MPSGLRLVTDFATLSEFPYGRHHRRTYCICSTAPPELPSPWMLHVRNGVSQAHPSGVVWRDILVAVTPNSSPFFDPHDRIVVCATSSKRSMPSNLFNKPPFANHMLRIASYLVLMIHKFVTSHAFKAELLKARRDPFSKWFQLRKLSPIVYLLIRDGVLYFAMYVTVFAIAPFSFHPILIFLRPQYSAGCFVSVYTICLL